MKFKRIFCFCFIFIIMFSINCYGHPGRTDSNGGHWNRSTGTYHYHNGGDSTKKNTVRENEYPTELKVYNLPDIMYIGDKVEIKSEIIPFNAYRNAVYTKSSDSSVIKADLYNETIEAMKEGIATITVYTVNNIKIEKSIKVLPLEAESIEIQRVIKGFITDDYEVVDEIVCKIGDSFDLWIKFNPENTTINKDVEFIIEDETILSKDFEALSAGEVIVTAKYGELTDSIKVIVNSIPTTRIEIKKDSNFPTKLWYKIGSEISFETSISPENTTDKSVIWSVSDEKKAIVDENGVLKCKKKGEIVLTATTVNGLSDSVTVEIYRYTFFEKVKIFFIVNFIGVILIVWLRKRAKREWLR